LIRLRKSIGTEEYLIEIEGHRNSQYGESDDQNEQ
jgi:hypothetical protein